MPYIAAKDRTKLNDSLKALVNELINPSATVAAKGEFFGFYVRRLTLQYVNSPRSGVLCKEIFHCGQFPEDVRRTLLGVADEIAVKLNDASPMETAGLLNYAISVPYWGLLGDAEGTPASYGLRAYLKGTLLEVLKWGDDLFLKPKNDSPTGIWAQAVIAYRKKLIVQGVLSDVLDEAYRRKTVPYEEEKARQNGDLWVNNEINFMGN